MSQHRSICLVSFVLIATSTACAVSRTETPPAPPAATATVAPAPTQAPQPTVKPAASAQPAPSATLPPSVTLTPTGTPAPTETVTPTPTGTATSTLATRPPVVIQRSRTPAAPLEVSYQVVDIQGASNGDATLILKVIATGGAGGYRYYNDDVLQPSATFTIPGRCGKPFVHTIKVTSADGQTVALPYLIGGTCPTTPTPTP